MAGGGVRNKDKGRPGGFRSAALGVSAICVAAGIGLGPHPALAALDEPGWHDEGSAGDVSRWAQRFMPAPFRKPSASP